MAIIPIIDPTLEALYAVIEKEDAVRPKFGRALGMGALQDCDRRTAYAFRNAKPEIFTYDALFRFADGHATEAVTIERLKKIPGITLIDRDPDTGKQISVSDIDGHSKGKLDGFILGLIQAPKKWHVYEGKAVSDKKLAEFRAMKNKVGEKFALRAWNLNYYKQAQKYMHYTHLDRHYCVVASAGGRAYESCRTEYDPTFAIRTIETARRIITDNTLPEKISKDPSFYQCGYCNFKDICHGNEMANRDCRNCIHSSPIESGKWSCSRWNVILDNFDHCPAHKFIPDYVAGKPIAADDFGITYAMKDGTTFKDSER